jgi:hypothetical protein
VITPAAPKDANSISTVRHKSLSTFFNISIKQNVTVRRHTGRVNYDLENAREWA